MAIILLYHKSKSAPLLKSLITCRKFCSWGQNLAEVVNVCTLPLNVKLSWTLSGNSPLPSFNHYPLVPTNKVYPTLERSTQGAHFGVSHCAHSQADANVDMTSKYIWTCLCFSVWVSSCPWCHCQTLGSCLVSAICEQRMWSAVGGVRGGHR